MLLEFKNVMPFPLKDYQHEETSVWKRGFQINFPKKVLLNASSGKGKSTFVSTAYGLRKDYTGSVLIDHKPIQEFSLEAWIELRRTRLSAVFQDLQLFPELTVWENLILKNDLTNHKSKEEIDSMLDLLGIGDKHDQVCGTLSLGQQQRVAIIRSLLQPFELLLMDEPFSHLDEKNASIALELIAKETDLNKGGFILTTLGSHHGFNYDEELKL
ncbi:ATP-binding cassette domain-containing protein [Crocinitomix algicola]|uniref:ATP-binding cassette domain-containing protein n=1 Tax=Crocinitomix algicola TaxID=1740263 RepID=UPI0008308F2B|nr:ATP-binding cassette domain-containing protein [Crocinitomix algicola]